MGMKEWQMPEGGVEPAAGTLSPLALTFFQLVRFLGLHNKLFFFVDFAVRFQNNMRWLGGVRDCVKWVQRQEFIQVRDTVA